MKRQTPSKNLTKPALKNRAIRKRDFQKPQNSARGMDESTMNIKKVSQDLDNSVMDVVAVGSSNNDVSVNMGDISMAGLSDNSEANIKKVTNMDDSVISDAIV